MSEQDKPDLPYGIWTLVCAGCGRVPAEIPVYLDLGSEEGISPEEYVMQNEGTLNRENGHFLCDECYIRWGQPVGERGKRWVAP